MRVTDDMVRHVLTWARNYKEIESYGLIAQSGRKWRIRLHQPVRVGARANVLDAILGIRPEDEVPAEMVLTSREAFLFGYGCAVGVTMHGRDNFAREQWGWGAKDATDDEAPQRASRAEIGTPHG
jgi:hypothetical protein